MERRGQGKERAKILHNFDKFEASEEKKSHKWLWRRVMVVPHSPFYQHAVTK